jgi:hypothetical protein
MNRPINPTIDRRDLLRGLTIGTIAAATTGVSQARADTESPDEKRKARYQANSPEVQTFYRVNRYPPA